MAEMDKSTTESLNVDFMRSLVKQYSELGQWTSAFFWADAAAAAGEGEGAASGDDIWLMASNMLARGELHRAAHTVVSRELHKSHLLCLGVAMRAYLAAKEPASALALLEDCDINMLEPKSTDQTHNRALAGVFVTQARALSSLERREAASEALAAALRADTACFEALDLLLRQHSLTPKQEHELLDSLETSSQLGPAEAALVRAAYKQCLMRYAVIKPEEEAEIQQTPIEEVRRRTSEGRISLARRLAASCRWKEALSVLDRLDPWCCPELRTACLVELKKSSELFAFAHALVDAYPNNWTSWYAVGCYYYLIGKSEAARRYLGKAKSLCPSAGCVWLAYGHCFAADNEHDQAMAAYFKACQLMPGCHLGPLYVGVECSSLNNAGMAQRYLARAALTQRDTQAEVEPSSPPSWEALAGMVQCPRVAHEAAAAALLHRDPAAAAKLAQRAIQLVHEHNMQLQPAWAATYEALGAARRKLGDYDGALECHAAARALRGRGGGAGAGLALLLGGRARAAADALHAALAADPDDAVAAAALDHALERLPDDEDDEIPQFPFPVVRFSPPPAAVTTPVAAAADVTQNTDMSMSFD